MVDDGRALRFAIIGAGMAGILSAIKLQDAGLTDFTVYEKADRVGGTWRENTYPGLSCDVPSHLYSYSFAPTPEWSHRFSPGEEIQGYFERVAREHGIEHSEMNPSPTEEVHFVQMWVPPDTDGIAPGYEQRDVNRELEKGGLRPVASGQGHEGAISIHQRDAVLWGARLEPGETATVPDAAHVHLFVAAGDADLEDAGALAEGDAARLTSAGARTLTAGPGGVEVLVWVTS